MGPHILSITTVWGSIFSWGRPEQITEVIIPLLENTITLQPAIERISCNVKIAACLGDVAHVEEVMEEQLLEIAPLIAPIALASRAHWGKVAFFVALSFCQRGHTLHIL